MTFFFCCLLYCLCTETGDVRLVGGSRPCTGKMELQNDDEWYSVNPKEWKWILSTVACKQLDCGAAVYSTVSSSGSKDEPTWYHGFLSCSESDEESDSLMSDCGIWHYANSPIPGGDNRLELVCAGNLRWRVKAG